MPALPAWHPADPRDIDAIHALSARIHPGHAERRAVFAERLALAPLFCLVLHDTQGLAGYCIAHPWAGPAPVLDTLLGQLPDPATTLYLHDIALDPRLRGRGAARSALACLERTASSNLPAISLTALAGTADLWSRLGFQPVGAMSADDHAALASYGPGAIKMVRPLANAVP
jgi:ribosomal protein S18 acetylase RimI-like enzyme